MKEVIYNPAIEEMRGEVFPGMVCRRKRHKADGANAFGKKEIYCPRKRDYTQHPLTEAEKRNTERFAKADAKMREELQNPERAAYWDARFAAQRKEPEAGNKKCYVRKDAFIRAMLMKEMAVG